MALDILRYRQCFPTFGLQIATTGKNPSANPVIKDSSSNAVLIGTKASRGWHSVVAFPGAMPSRVVGIRRRRRLIDHGFLGLRARCRVSYSVSFYASQHNRHGVLGIPSPRACGVAQTANKNLRLEPTKHGRQSNVIHDGDVITTGRGSPGHRRALKPSRIGIGTREAREDTTKRGRTLMLGAGVLLSLASRGCHLRSRNKLSPR